MMNKISKFKEYILKYQLGLSLDNVSFKCLTTLGVGGSCKLLYIPDDIETLVLSIKYLINQQIRYFIIGAGTNLLVDDKDFDLVVISLKNIKRCYLLEEDDKYNYIYAESGLRGMILSKYLIDRSISGGEFLSVIPGTIGGITYMNAGAYKKSISDIIHSITYINEHGDVVTEENINNCFDFKYRSSIFKNKAYVIISIIVKLPKLDTDINVSKNLISSYILRKKNTQPLSEKNAGSTFKNLDNIYTWEVVDRLGLRGYSIGDAKISNKHANFIINKNNATFKDMINLINKIKDDALNKYNIKLECEWEILE